MNKTKRTRLLANLSHASTETQLKAGIKPEDITPPRFKITTRNGSRTIPMPSSLLRMESHNKGTMKKIKLKKRGHKKTTFASRKINVRHDMQEALDA